MSQSMATFGAKRTLASVAEQSRFYEYNDRRLAGNDDRQVRDGHPLAIERQTLGRVKRISALHAKHFISAPGPQ